MSLAASRFFSSTSRVLGSAKTCWALWWLAIASHRCRGSSHDCPPSGLRPMRVYADVNVAAAFTVFFDLTLDLSAGLDTRGLLLPEKNFLSGFYLGDFDPNTNGNGVIDPTDEDVPDEQEG